MKKKKWMALGMMLVFVVCVACNGSEASETAAIENVEMRVVEGSVDSQPTGAEAEGILVQYAFEETESIQKEIVTQNLTIYYSNQRADGLETEILSDKELTAEGLISALSRHNIVSIDTKVVAFEILKEQDKTILKLDLSKAFGEYLKTMGKSGEDVVIAALTNTFLDNYQAEGLWLTVEGQTLETANASYEKELIYSEYNK